jgi:DNA modification methylase
MLRDLRNTNIKPVETRIEIGDARNLELEDNTVDAIITSRPYLNKIEYTKVYGIEMYFLGFPETKLRSYIGARVRDIDISKLGLDQNLPPVAKAYFNDIYLALKEMYRVCKENAELAIVIGGGCFPDRVVEADKLTAELSEKIGFVVKNILVARESWCTRARTIKVGKIRESVILLRK